MAERYLTIKEICTRTGMGKAVVRKWIDNGDLKAKNFGSDLRNKKPRWRVKESDFEKFEQLREHQIVKA